MAVLTSFDKNFEITAISFTPNIITIGEETSYQITIKNVSGKKVNSMRMDMQLYYRDTGGSVRGSISNDVYSGNLEYGFKSISWASGSSKTFSGKFTFTPLSSYPAKIDTRLLPMFKGSDIGYTSDGLDNVRLGLQLGITADVIFGDFFNNSDYFFDVRGVNSENLYVIDARYTPSISLFEAVRAMDGKENDEGENLLANITLKKSAAGKPANMSMILYYQDKTKPETTPGSVDLSEHILSALNGAKGILVEKLLGKNSDWNLRLWFGDKYEFAEMSLPLSRSFANVHLSGASTGGVCFGSFSRATENNPVFQCYYPAEFDKGIKGGFTYEAGEVNTGGKWIDGNPIYRSVFKADSTKANADNTIGTIADLGEVVSIYGKHVQFNHTFPLNFFRNDTYYCRAYVSKTGNIVVNSYNSVSCVVIVEYTKSKPEEEVS